MGSACRKTISPISSARSRGPEPAAFLDQSCGTEAETEENGPPELDLIGQFGIGFYSAFMVADHVDVVTRRAGTTRPLFGIRTARARFRSSRARSRTPRPREPASFSILTDAVEDYLDPTPIERIVREHSSALTVPIELVDGRDAASRADEARKRRASRAAHRWLGALDQAKSAITEEDYTEFYQSLGGAFDEPALTVHWRAEGRQEYTVLAFVPGSRPFDLFDPARQGRGKLYVRHVLITEDAELLPRWLRFVRLVVDSADLPLNVSREMIQESPVFAAIKKASPTASCRS